MQHEQLWPYSERGGSRAADFLASLQQPPEFLLTDEEREQALAFGHELAYGRTGTLEVSTGNTLQYVDEMTYLSSERVLHPDYFASPAGQADAEQLGLTDTPPDRIAERLWNAPGLLEHASEDQIAAISNRSKKWFNGLLQAQLGAEPATDAAFREPEAVMLQLHPERFLDRLENLQAYRNFYRQVRQQVNRYYDSPQLLEAKNTLINVHWAKVNSMTAQMYSHAVHLFRQLDQPDADEQTREFQRRLVQCVPFLKDVQQAEVAERVRRLTAIAERLEPRMDHIRFGIDMADEGTFTPVSRELVALATELETHQEVAPTATVPPEMITAMQSTRWQAPTFKAFIEATLSRLDLLSSEVVNAATARSRQGRAADDKWQVVITPDFDVLTVHAQEGVLYVPESFDRSLLQTSPSGALPVAAHELTHVLQAENSRRLRQQLPLIAIRGRRYVTVTEMGGIVYEREVFERAGLARPSNLHYLRSLQTKLAGGNAVQVARAFFDSANQGKTLSDDQLQKRRKSAVGSSRRHYRSGYNTQALDYLEQELIVRSLASYDKSFRDTIAQSASGLSLADIAALHRVGLWNLPEAPSVNPADVVLDVYRDQFYEAKNIEK